MNNEIPSTHLDTGGESRRISRPDGSIVERTIDPCPTCHEPITGIDVKPEYVYSDPHGESIDGVFIPSGLPPVPHRVAEWWTFKPCGHELNHLEIQQSGWSITDRVVRESEVVRLRALLEQHGIDPDEADAGVHGV